MLRPILSGSASRLVLAAASCAFLVVVSVKLIDRPVATWVHAHLGLAHFVWHTAFDGQHWLAIDPFNLMIGPAELLRALAPVVLAIVVLAAAARRQAGSRGRILLALSLSIPLAMDVNVMAQWAFGRTWPESWLGNNPSWIRDGMFGFFPFHGGGAWQSFPSDHTSVTTALATLLWIVWPRSRPLCITIVAIDMAGLIGANYHFVSDIIAGVYLGVAIGRGMGALMLPNAAR